MISRKIPRWYTTVLMSDPVDTPIRRSLKRKNFVRKALHDIISALSRVDLSGERYGSWLSQLDPAAKVGGTLVLVIGATLLNSPLSLVILFIVACIILATGKVSLKGLPVIWLGIPLFSLLLIFPAALSIVTPGTPVLQLFDDTSVTKTIPWIPFENLSITREGLVVAARFLLRSIDCTTFIYILIASTDSAVILASLKHLGLPAAFGMVLTMTRQYIILLLKVAGELHLAKLSRTIEDGPVSGDQKWTAAGIGILFHKVYRLSGEVQNAMIARGFDGDLQERKHSNFRCIDGLAIAGSIILVVSAICFDSKLQEVLWGVLPFLK